MTPARLSVNDMNEKENCSGSSARQSADPLSKTRAHGSRKAPAAESYSFLHPPVERDEIGRLGNYRVLRLLGTGGMGMVFHAEDIALRRPVALKVMRPEEEQKGDRAWQRFLREARAMAAIKHDHLVTVYQVGQEGDTIYLAMELLEGQSLDDWIESCAPEDMVQILRIGQEIADGLSAIHERGLVHRDIKPANIWLEARRRRDGETERPRDKEAEKKPSASVSSSPRPSVSPSLGSGEYRVKILDFGLARDASEESRITEAGMLVGTPAFLSPEQARGLPADFRSDLFSFGCVLYCMCSKQLPFQGKNTLDQLAALATHNPAPVRELNPSVPESLSDLIAELLAREPSDRPASATEVGRRLLDIRRSLTSRRRSVASGERPTQRITGKAKLPRREPWLHTLGGKIALAAGSFVGVLAVMGLTYLMVSSGGSRSNGSDTPVEGKQVAVEKPASSKQFLSEMSKLEAVNWPFHKPKPGKGPKGGKGPPPELNGPISVKGQLSPHGIFMHPAPPDDAPASISYSLNQQFRSFSAEASLNDSSPVSPSGLTFAVYGDGKLLWQSQEISTQAQTQKCDVSVSGVRVLKIEVIASGDVRKAHSVWIEPSLTK